MDDLCGSDSGFDTDQPHQPRQISSGGYLLQVRPGTAIKIELPMGACGYSDSRSLLVLRGVQSERPVTTRSDSDSESERRRSALNQGDVLRDREAAGEPDTRIPDPNS